MKARALIEIVYGANSCQIQSFKLPPQDADGLSSAERIRRRLPVIEKLADALDTVRLHRRIFIGHGGSSQWRELKDLLVERLGQQVSEFNLEPVAGIQTSDRLREMREQAGLAFLVMTGEDALANGTFQARPNVIHEVGLFQGHLGLQRAIVMIEEGCTSFSNLDGLTTIRFPKSDISARFENVRGVLIREGFMSK